MSKEYEEYLESGQWLCMRSPTNAHHWLVGRPKHGKVRGRCKYCGMVRKFERPPINTYLPTSESAEVLLESLRKS